MKCPLLNKKCIEAKCKFWTHLYGKNPQGEGMIDAYDCAISFLPILLVENAQMIRNSASSTDKVANLIARASQIALHKNQIGLNEEEPLVENKKVVE